MSARKALELRPLPESLKCESFDNLAEALWKRFQQGSGMGDLEEAISLHRQALELRPAPHPLRPDSLNNISKVLLARFDCGNGPGDLNEAILLSKEALEIQLPTHPFQFESPDNPDNSPCTRLWEEDRQLNLKKAIFLHRKTLDLRVLPHLDRSMSINNLALGLCRRFRQWGQQFDLDKAILLHREALELRISPHPYRYTSLNDLALALWTRFRQGGQQVDLNEAILLHRQSLELLPTPHTDRSKFLNNLATALHAQFEQGGQQDDLEEAILLHRKSLGVAPHHDRATILDNLALTLATRFEQGGQQSDLDEAIFLHGQALDLRGQIHDLNEAVSFNRKALQLRVPPHPEQSRSLYQLGTALLTAHSVAPNNSDYLNEAMELFHSAIQCLNQSASLRLHIAHTWITEGILHGHSSVIDAYEAALQALPKLAALSFNVKLRQEGLLENSDGLARDASKFAIQIGKIDKAIEFLEEGRAVFWSQFLSLRSPFERLIDVAPELADKLRDTASALELGSHRDTQADSSANRERLVIDQETAQLNRINEEWSKTIEDVRKLDGFEDFLRPRSLSTLQRAATDGPVVMLVGNEEGSNILILTSANIHSISLPGLPTRELQSLVHLVQAASSNSEYWRSPFKELFSTNTTIFPEATREALHNLSEQDKERGMRYKNQASSDDIFKFILETLWKKIVKPVIDELNLKKSKEPLAVRWCPTGLFSFLPIHAAGCYNDDTNAECASDYFISSYTPTIGALLTQDRPPSAERFKMMVAIQSRELPSTRLELEKIEQHVPSDSLIKFGIADAVASVEAVASKLPDVSIVHFSCHGTQDQSNPLNSGLKLEDGWLRVSRIMKEKIPNGALAFLCACETAMGVEKLPDEAMSLGASLLFSGFRQVIATMWEMMDEDGPVIADVFYKELFRGPDGEPTQEPDVNKSARALHLAVKELRAKNVSFRRWVPFIHMGK
ncbi:hypothetical protein GALMADRAFT_147180 [Galerina marginata CBS 339.88]|uniref:CHAT domain-containing protein n=1 Tax=Galerina marginata (strain CBS 339.88) TaxID=685588 RepID=A0A067SI56_GALM3|nr:hypothetical protein GALMADRAFT_147180 [Galerina marginata CBS 339.88]